MNKKIGIIMVFVLLVGAVFLNGCSSLDPDAVGRRILAKNGDGPAQAQLPDEDGGETFAFDDGGENMDRSIVLIGWCKCKSSGGGYINRPQMTGDTCEEVCGDRGTY